jgi:hypothetical protein
VYPSWAARRRGTQGGSSGRNEAHPDFVTHRTRAGKKLGAAWGKRRPSAHPEGGNQGARCCIRADSGEKTCDGRLGSADAVPKRRRVIRRGDATALTASSEASFWFMPGWCARIAISATWYAS